MSKKVLHVVNSSFTLPYYFGDQLLHFKKLGYEFYIACPADEALKEYCQSQEVEMIDLPLTREVSPFKDLRAIGVLLRAIRKNKIDIVIGHTPKGGLVAMIAAKLANVQDRIYFRHGLLYETARGRIKRLLLAIERFTAFLAQKVVCVSPSVLHVSEKIKLNDPKKNLLLAFGTCNGVDTRKKFNPKFYPSDIIQLAREKWNLTDQELIVGFVGRVVQDKGMEELINAWERIKSEHPQWKLMIVGPMEDRDQVSEQVKHQIQEDPSIIYTGHQDDIATLYALMDIFILPSYREGFPTVVLEASAMKLPVVTTKSTGCIDAIVESETGFFAKIDAKDIAQQLNKLMKDASLRTEMGNNGRAWVKKKFDHEIVWKAIEEKLLPKVN